MNQTNPTRRRWRLFSLETLLALMGIGLLAAGAATGTDVGLFWGAITLVGLTVLHFVRKKDWEKHWREQEEERNRRGRQ